MLNLLQVVISLILIVLTKKQVCNIFFNAVFKILDFNCFSHNIIKSPLIIVPGYLDLLINTLTEFCITTFAGS